MKINNADRVHGTTEAIEEFRVFSRALDKSIDSITHYVYAIKGIDNPKLLELQRKYWELMEEFQNLQI